MRAKTRGDTGSPISEGRWSFASARASKHTSPKFMFNMMTKQMLEFAQTEMEKL